MANMGIRYLAPSKPHGQELLAHIKLATSFLAIYIGLLTRFSVPLDLRGRFLLRNIGDTVAERNVGAYRAHHNDLPDKPIRAGRRYRSPSAIVTVTDHKAAPSSC